MKGFENRRRNEVELEPLRACKSFKLRTSSPTFVPMAIRLHPCRLSLTIGGIHDRRFQFCTLLTDQQPRVRLAAGNVRNWATHAAAMAFVPELEATLSPPVQREGTPSNRATSKHRTVQAISITRRVLNTPEEANSLRSL